jgi:hypothetical protein
MPLVMNGTAHVLSVEAMIGSVFGQIEKTKTVKILAVGVIAANVDGMVMLFLM